MNEQQLVAMLQAEARQAVGYYSGAIATEQDRALDYYYGRPFGDEVAGRSQVVSRDVAEVIDGYLPDLIRVFVSGDQVVAFEPAQPEDEPFAKQATEYVNYIFWRDNAGFRVMHDWFKDALLQKIGVVMVYWDDRDRTTRVEYDDQPVEVLEQFLAMGLEIEDIAQTEGDAEMGAAPAFSFTVVRRMPKTVRLVNVPPEEFLIPPRTRDIDTSRYVARRCRKPRSELVEMGFSRSVVADLPSAEFAGDDQWGREYTRFRDETYGPDDNAPSDDPSQEMVEVYDEFVLVDYDGDGISERRHVIRVDETILSNEEVDDHPFAVLTPIPMPHAVYGLSIADQTMDVQRVASVLWRQQLDALYLANNPRTAVDTTGDSVNLDDLLTSRPGGVIRVQGEPGSKIMPMPAQELPQSGFAMIEYIEGVKERRTGLTRYNQGLDADSLNKTATGIRQIMEAAQGRKELIARVFAETGVSVAFRKMLRLVVQHQDQPRVLRLRDDFVPVDPRYWNAEMDVVINVGLGSGNKDQMLAHLAGISQKQENILQLMGPTNPLVGLKHLYNSYSRMVENAGLKSPELYFMDPEGEEAQALMQQAAEQAAANPPPPDPVVMGVMKDFEARMAETQRKGAADALKAQETQGKLQLQAEQLRLDAARSAAEMRAEMQQFMAKLAEDRRHHAADIAAQIADSLRDHAIARAKLEIEDRKVDVQEDQVDAQREAARQRPDDQDGGRP